MSKSTYLTAVDGLPARGSGVWARDKLFIVERYMTIFSAGMQFKWAYRTYVDLMAGPGLCVFEDDREEFLGSPLLALAIDPPFTTVVLVEEDGELFAALEQRTAGATTPQPILLNRNCNAMEAIAEIRPHLSSAGLSLAFADMLGLDVDFATIAALSDNRRLDWLITFQVGDLNRNARDAMRVPEEGARLDRFFGNAGWRDVVRQHDAGQREGRDLAAMLTTYYGEQLRTLGYEHVAEYHRIMRNTKGAPLYRLLLAGKHERAEEFFDKISRVTYEGNRRLF